MGKPKEHRRPGCAACTSDVGLGFDFSMAFQPIVDARTGEVYSQEALVRGLNNESAADVFSNVNADNLYRFDQACRVKAIKLAAELGIPTFLNVNFMPNAVYQPERCIQTALETAGAHGFPTDRIVFEITEGELVANVPHLQSIVTDYQPGRDRRLRRRLRRPEPAGGTTNRPGQAGHGLDPRDPPGPNPTDHLPRNHPSLPGLGDRDHRRGDRDA